MGELEALFDSVDGFKEDLFEFGKVGAGIIASQVAWAVVDQQLTKYAGMIPGWGKNLLAIGLGVLSVRYVTRVNHMFGIGFAGGLVGAGALGLVKSIPGTASFMAQIPGLSTTGVAGLGSDPFAQYLNAAPISIEEVSGLGEEEEIEVGGMSGVAASLTA